MIEACTHVQFLHLLVIHLTLSPHTSAGIYVWQDCTDSRSRGRHKLQMSATRKVQAIFGYGSLINHESRRSTADSHGNAAVCLRLKSSFGFKRVWNYRSKTGFTALGLSKRSLQDSAHQGVVGVLFPVGESEMDLYPYDEREVGYKRVRVPLTEFEIPKYGDECCSTGYQDGEVNTDLVPGKVRTLHGVLAYIETLSSSEALEAMVRTLVSAISCNPNSLSEENASDCSEMQVFAWIYVPLAGNAQLPDHDHPVET